MIKKAFIMPHPPIIIPEIGSGKEKKAQRTIDGCKKAAAEIALYKPDTIIIISPHGPAYSNVICIAADPVLKGDFGGFGKKRLSYEFDNDMELVDSIATALESEGFFTVKNNTKTRERYDIDNLIDHGALVPLFFVAKKYPVFNLVHIATGLPNPEDLYKCGIAIQEVCSASGKKVVLIASGDLSHKLTHDGPYEYNPKGHIYDEFVVKCIEENNFSALMDTSPYLRECAGECGHKPINIMLGLFERRSCNTEVYSYEGPFGVGYMTACIEDIGEGRSVLEEYRTQKKKGIAELRKNESPYVKLARNTIERFVISGEKPEPFGPQKERKGSFVSIKKNGILRGCIGTIGPTKNCIENEIVDNAIKAATEDPRFPPIEPDELENLVISVDILAESEKIKSRDMLDVNEYGVIVSKGIRRGLLLPNLEGVDTVDEQIRIALSKAEISQEDEYELERFRVVRYK